MPKKVVILGGGVAGLSAAHELAERGFQVAVYEAQQVPGGKARSLSAPGTGIAGRKGLPGEHGFRFFPGFYRHVIDTMSRIPVKGGRHVDDNLVETTRIALARHDTPPLIMDARVPRTIGDVRVILGDLADRSVNISHEDKRFFLDRMWQLLTSCEARRLDEYEKLGWWDFIGAAERSPEYQKYLCYGLTRTMVAAQPQLASTKTGGNILIQLALNMIEPGVGSDRVLNGPTNEVWIDPWLAYLRQIGVEYNLGAEVASINCSDGIITSATIKQNGHMFDVTGDFYISALPVERMAPLVTPAMLDTDPRLESVKLIQRHVHMMNGIQFFLNRDFPLVHGHTIYFDSPWALTSVSQAQFWPDVDLAEYGDGTTRGIISVDISEWNETGRTTFKPAIDCTPSEIAREVWEELKNSWNGLEDHYLQSWFLDPDISETPMKDRDQEYLLVNEINTWGLRPDVFTRIPNLFLAADYVRTNTDLATMEAANEAARRAVNSIIDAADSSAPYCQVWKLREPIIFAPWRAEDEERYALGLPWNGRPNWEEATRYHLVRPVEALAESIFRGTARERAELGELAHAVEHFASSVRRRVAGIDATTAHVSASSRSETTSVTVTVDVQTAPNPLNIAVLGGGIGSLAAVLALTDPNNPARERIGNVTVYQLGWRLGGKGASGRGQYDRIEEHGLHIWLGFYENAFRMIREVYRELGRDANAPLATWDQAFKQHKLWVVDEQVNGSWKHWPFEFPTDNATPGTGGELPTMHEYLELLLGLLREQFHESPHAAVDVHHLTGSTERLLREFVPDAENATRVQAHRFLHLAHDMVSRVHPSQSVEPAQHYYRVANLLDEFSGWLHERRASAVEEPDGVRRTHLLVELLAATARGLIRDVLLSRNHDLSKLDGEDFRDWLKRHGASEEVYDSAPVRGFIYDLAFAYENGDPNRPAFAAGTALRCALRVLFTYKGAIFWKMQAGMGDTIFGPIYEVLRKRGVKFEFFHAVRNVALSPDRSAISAIQIGRQVTLKDGAYQPLRDVDGLPCWPSSPDFDQIVEGAELREKGINLESFWTPWPDRESISLEAGRDFDIAILGIPVGSLPYICPELIEASDKWRDMVQRVETTRTQAFQLWMQPTINAMGWTGGSPVLDGYVQSLNTWADMSQLIDRENWPDAESPGSIAYFCGPMQGEIPDRDDHDAPERETQHVKDAARTMLVNHIEPLWPRAVGADQETSLSWSLLLDPTGSSGTERLDSQFFRANIDPSERYVLSVPGSSRYRLSPGKSGFRNLVLAGDWTDNGINAGCIEATVMSGLLASQAICGYPEDPDIVGLGHP